MKNKSFLVISLLLLLTGLSITGKSFAWEIDFTYGCYSSTTGCSSSSYRCLFSSTSYDQCLSTIQDRAKDDASYHISLRQGNAYIYTSDFAQMSNSTMVWTGSRIWRLLREPGQVVPTPPGGSTSPIYGAPATPAVCNNQYSSGAWFSPGQTQFDDGNGCTVVADSDSIGFCLADENGNSTSCYMDVLEAYPNGGAYYDSDFSEPTDPNAQPYLTEVATCDSGSCVMLNGKLYEVDQDAIDSGSITSGGGDWIIGDPDGPYGSNTGYTPPSDGGGDPGDGGGDPGDGSGSGGSGATAEELAAAFGDLFGSGWGDGVNESGDGEGEGFSDPELPIELIDFAEDAITWEHGLPISASQCPAPQSVSIGFGSFSTDLEFSYQPFCDLASYIRALILAAAYIVAAFVVFRGLT